MQTLAAISLILTGLALTAHSSAGESCQAGESSYAYLRKSRSLYATRPKTINVAVNMQFVTRNIKKVAEYIQMALLKWKKGPVKLKESSKQREFEPVIWPENMTRNRSKPAIYKTQNDVATLTDIIESCTDYGLRNIVLNRLTKDEVVHLLRLACPLEETFKDQEKWIKDCQSNQDPITCKQAVPEGADFTMSEYNRAEQCGFYYQKSNNQRRGLPANFKQIPMNSNPMAEIVFEEAYTEVWNDEGMWPHSIKYEKYPLKMNSYRVQCNQHSSIPNTNNANDTSSTHERCNKEIHHTPLFCEDKKSFVHQNRYSWEYKSYKKFQEEAQRLAKGIQDLQSGWQALLENSKAQVQGKVVNLIPSDHWRSLEEALKQIADEEGEFDTAALMMMTKIIPQMRAMSILAAREKVEVEILSETDVTMQLMLQNQTISGSKVVYIRPNSIIQPYGKLMGDKYFTKLPVDILTLGEENKYIISQIESKNTHGFVVTDGYTMERQLTARKSGLATFESDPTDELECEDVRTRSQYLHVCRNADQLFEGGDEACGKDILNNVIPPRCPLLETSSPTLNYNCNIRALQVTSPHFLKAKQMCTGVRRPVSSDSALFLPKGSVTLTGTCKIMFEDQVVYPGGDQIPQIPHEAYTSWGDELRYVFIDQGGLKTGLLVIGVMGAIGLMIGTKYIRKSTSGSGCIIGMQIFDQICKSCFSCQMREEMRNLAMILNSRRPSHTMGAAAPQQREPSLAGSDKFELPVQSRAVTPAALLTNEPGIPPALMRPEPIGGSSGLWNPNTSGPLYGVDYPTYPGRR